MYRWIVPALVLVALAGCRAGLSSQVPAPQTTANLCSDSWYASVEERVGSGDGQGHGPDLGSAEWKSVVAFRLGLRDNPALPDPNTPAWCQYIEQRLEE